MSDVFLSYAKEDASRIRPLIRALEGAGLTVFWDQNIPPGATWRSVIGEQLESARCVVVVWTENSVLREWVVEEAEMGKSLGRLLPVRLDNAVQLPLGFGQVQTASLEGWKGLSSDEPIFQAFVKSLRNFLNEKSRITDGENEKPAHVSQYSFNLPRELHVLIVESSLVNQVFAQRVFEKYAHTWTIAVNSDEALRVFERESFDLVLIQLTLTGELGGYGTSRAIRAIEARTGRTFQASIFGMSSGTDSKSACIAAGMDCVISRPISENTYEDAIRTIYQLMDWRSVLETPGFDVDLATKVASCVGKDLDSGLSALNKSLTLGDAEDFAKICHSMKGAVSNLSAPAVVELLNDMCSIAREDALTACLPKLEILSRWVPRIIKEIEIGISLLSKQESPSERCL